MMRSGYDCLKSHVLRCWRNDVNDWAVVVSFGSGRHIGSTSVEVPASPSHPAHLCLRGLLLWIYKKLSYRRETA